MDGQFGMMISDDHHRCGEERAEPRGKVTFVQVAKVRFSPVGSKGSALEVEAEGGFKLKTAKV